MKDDLDKYISRRKKRDGKFAENFESGYQELKVGVPAEALGDADHLALASFYNCDMLVTWNCRHLANANKAGHIRRVNALLGLRTPLLVTPLELLEQDYENET